METQERSSRKRKQPPSSSNSNPFVGILTRHKSQKFFFHHNRSGSSRKSRAFPSSLTNPNLPTNKKLPDCNFHAVDDDDDDEIYHITIKDLRARRVFSKPPKSEAVVQSTDDSLGKNANPNFDSELIISKLDEFVGKSDGNGTLIEIPKSSVMGICDSFNGEDLDGGNPNLLLTENSNECGKADAKDEGSNGGNTNLSVLEKCGDYVVDTKDDCNEGSPNLSMSDKCVDSRVDCEEGDSSDQNPNLSMSVKYVDSRVDSKSECLNGENTNLSIEGFGAKDDFGGRVADDMSPSLGSKDLKRRNGEDCEDDVQTTPPDAVVLLRRSDDPSVLQSRSADSRLPSKPISPSKGGSAEGKKSFSNSRRFMGLNPCSRLKIFKAPNSFSYRRLLPYLMDLAKDSPSAPKVNSGIKIDTDIEEKPLISSSQESVVDSPKMDEMSLATAVACNPQEMNTESQIEEKLNLDPKMDHFKSNDFSAEQAGSCSPVDCPLEKNQENPVSDESQIGTPVSDDSNNGGASLDEQISLDNVGKLGDITPIVESDPAATLHSPKSSPDHSGEDATFNTPSHLSLSAEKECREAHIESKSEESSISLFESSSKMDAIISSDVPGFGLAKGILKRNPRGCRGICNCLNCASFRLNAEKAFEFSRNQWLDAEELAMDLMKELSNLRCMLQKSVNGDNDNAIVPVDQVQEFCRRASNAEDIARNRLSQLKEDLHVHCRIKPLQRPRVTFISSVQEKIMGPESTNQAT